MRIALLWSGITGYIAGWMRAMEDAGHETFIAYRSVLEDAPWDNDRLTFGGQRYVYDDEVDVDDLVAQLRRFGPDCVLVGGWHIGRYNKAVAGLDPLPVRVVCMDNQWQPTVKQVAGVLSAPLFVQRRFDLAFVPGDRQYLFARRLGFSTDQIIRGFHTANYDAYSAIPGPVESAERRAFLFVGRLVDTKGVDVLARAYQSYRASVPAEDALPLIVAGTGPMRVLLEGIPGVELVGFLDEAELIEAMGRAACLVCPSRFEPWGVVINEATAAGLAVIASGAVGAAVHLVQPGFNGWIVEPGDVESLAGALRGFGSLDAGQRAVLSSGSRSLAPQFTPERWVANLEAGIHRARPRLSG